MLSTATGVSAQLKNYLISGKIKESTVDYNQYYLISFSLTLAFLRASEVATRADGAYIILMRGCFSLLFLGVPLPVWPDDGATLNHKPTGRRQAALPAGRLCSRGNNL